MILFIGNFLQHVPPMIVKLKRSILQQFSSSRRPSEGFDLLTRKWIRMDSLRALIMMRSAPNVSLTHQGDGVIPKTTQTFTWASG